MPIPDILRLLVKKNIFVTAATAPWNAKTDAKGLENPWMDAVLSIYCGGCTAMNVISYIRNCQIFSLNSNILKLRSLKIPKTDTLLLKTAMRRRLKWPCSDGRHGLLPSALSSTLFYVWSVLSRPPPLQNFTDGTSLVGALRKRSSGWPQLFLSSSMPEDILKQLRYFQTPPFHLLWFDGNALPVYNAFIKH